MASMNLENCVEQALSLLADDVRARFAGDPMVVLRDDLKLTVTAVEHLSEARTDGGACDGVSFLKDGVILYAPTPWSRRENFTLAHELGHWVLHRAGRQALFCRRTTVDETVTLPARDIEEEASAFSAALLMPQWLFVREHARCGGDVATLSAAFGSSLAATERRIASLF